MTTATRSFDTILKSLNDAKAGLDALLTNRDTLQKIADAAHACSVAAQARRKIYSCGNGGSMCDAMHFAEELTGRFRQDRPAVAAVAISDPSHISCVGNDYGYEFIFSRYLEAHAGSGDILLAISTSGSSKNVLKAVETAKKLGVKVIALTGKFECPLATMADIHIPTPAGQWADRVQELHIKVIHCLIELIELELAQRS